MVADSIDSYREALDLARREFALKKQQAATLKLEIEACDKQIMELRRVIIAIAQQLDIPHELPPEEKPQRAWKKKQP